jgi:putative solute:sodium symporter small subunit
MLPFSIASDPTQDWAWSSGKMRGVPLSADSSAPSHTNIRPHETGPVNRKGGKPPMTTSANDQAHWKKTTNLMWIHLGLWLFFGYIVHMFVNVLNKIVILGFPLGFYMAAQGSLIAFVVMLFVFAKQQDKIDREYGYAED